MTTEKTINEVQVVFRDTIPAEFGWGLATAMNRLLAMWNDKIEELQGGDEDKDVFIPGTVVVEMMQEALSLADATKLVRGAVESWDFDGDLSKPGCCNAIPTLSLSLILVEARRIYYGFPLSGE